MLPELAAAIEDVKASTTTTTTTTKKKNTEIELSD